MNVVYRFFNTIDSFGPTLLRLLLAVLVALHGAQKVFGIMGGEGWAATLTEWTSAEGYNIPYPFAVCGMVMGLAGAVGLLLGFLTRFAALGIFSIVTVAVLTVRPGGGFFAPQGIEYPLTLAVVALSLVFSGGGKYSFDKAITRQLLPPYTGLLS